MTVHHPSPTSSHQASLELPAEGDDLWEPPVCLLGPLVEEPPLEGHPETPGAALVEVPPGSGSFSPLQTLTSGQRREVKGGGGAMQAHACVVRCDEDAREVLEALQEADAFKSVTNWCYAYGFVDQATQQPREVVADGLDEGCGDKLQGVLRRYALQGFLLVVSRWQDYGETPGLELLGTALYGQVVERCKDLIINLKQAMGLMDGGGEVVEAKEKLVEPLPPPGPKTFEFCSLPALPEPRVQTRYGPNHFLSDTKLNRPVSLPNLFSGGDVRLWMANDQCLRSLPEEDIRALRSLRQPDWRVEEVLQAVAALRGQVLRASGTAAARWGQCKELLKSPTLRTELLLFDASQVSPEQAVQALQLLDGLDVEDIRRASPGAAALFEWACGVARWRLQGPPQTPGPLGAAEQKIVHLPVQKKVPPSVAAADTARRKMTRSGSTPFAKTMQSSGFGISMGRIRASPSGPKYGSSLNKNLSSPQLVH